MTIKPFYSGVAGFDLKVSEIEKKSPEVARWVGNGTFFAYGNDHDSFTIQKNGDGSLRRYLFKARPQGWDTQYVADTRNVASLRAAILDEHSAWDHKYKELIRLCDDRIQVKSLYMLPPGNRWASRPCFTVIGDAAHLMTPFAGEGVNAALADAMSLADHIIQNPTDLSAAVKLYEDEMFPRAEEVMSETWENLKLVFCTENPLEAILKSVSERGPPPA